jgi:hypothetical protein
LLLGIQDLDAQRARTTFLLRPLRTLLGEEASSGAKELPERV